jgi:hypothetical protein
MMASATAQQPTESPNGPTESKVGDKGNTPAVGIRPTEDL